MIVSKLIFIFIQNVKLAKWYSYQSKETQAKKGLPRFMIFFLSFPFIPLILGVSTLELSIDRSSRRRSSVKKGVLRNFAKFTGKHLCQSLFFNKFAGLRPSTLSKGHTCFLVNFAKFLRTPFLQNTSGRKSTDKWSLTCFKSILKISHSNYL